MDSHSPMLPPSFSETKAWLPQWMQGWPTAHFVPGASPSAQGSPSTVPYAAASAMPSMRLCSETQNGTGDSHHTYTQSPIPSLCLFLTPSPSPTPSPTLSPTQIPAQSPIFPPNANPNPDPDPNPNPNSPAASNEEGWHKMNDGKSPTSSHDRRADQPSAPTRASQIPLSQIEPESAVSLSVSAAEATAVMKLLVESESGDTQSGAMLGSESVSGLGSGWVSVSGSMRVSGGGSGPGRQKRMRVRWVVTEAAVRLRSARVDLGLDDPHLQSDGGQLCTASEVSQGILSDDDLDMDAVYREVGICQLEDSADSASNQSPSVNVTDFTGKFPADSAGPGDELDSPNAASSQVPGGWAGTQPAELIFADVAEDLLGSRAETEPAGTGSADVAVPEPPGSQHAADMATSQSPAGPEDREAPEAGPAESPQAESAQVAGCDWTESSLVAEGEVAMAASLIAHLIADSEVPGVRPLGCDPPTSAGEEVQDQEGDLVSPAAYLASTHKVFQFGQPDSSQLAGVVPGVLLGKPVEASVLDQWRDRSLPPPAQQGEDEDQVADGFLTPRPQKRTRRQSSAPKLGGTRTKYNLRVTRPKYGALPLVRSSLASRVSRKRKAAEPSGSPGVFSGRSFLLTGMSRLERQLLEKDIREQGGLVLEDVPTLSPNPAEGPGQANMRMPGGADIILIAPRELRTFKYIYAIVSGLPCVAPGWVTASVAAESACPYSSYWIGADTSRGPHRSLTGCQVSLWGSTEFQAMFGSLVKLAGGEVMSSLRRDPIGRGFRVAVAQSGFKAPTHLLRSAASKKFPVVNQEWLTQSLLQNTLLEVSSYQNCSRESELETSPAGSPASSPETETSRGARQDEMNAQEIGSRRHPARNIFPEASREQNTSNSHGMFWKGGGKGGNVPSTSSTGPRNSPTVEEHSSSQGNHSRILQFVGKAHPTAQSAARARRDSLEGSADVVGLQRCSSTKALKSRARFYCGALIGEMSVAVGDCVELRPAGQHEPPYVGKIHSIWDSTHNDNGARGDREGSHMARCQWFYRPEETPFACMSDGRLHLYLSDHFDDVPLGSILRKVIVQESPPSSSSCVQRIVRKTRVGSIGDSLHGSGDYCCNFFYKFKEESLLALAP